MKSLANKNRFKIIELTQNKEPSIIQLSKELNLSYTKCADYIIFLGTKQLISKRKCEKFVYVKSRAKISVSTIKF